MRRQDTPVRAGTLLLLSFQYERTRTVAEQHAGGAIVPIEDA